MKISVQLHGHKPAEPIEIADLFARMGDTPLDDCGGAVEDAQRAADAACKALGRLTALMADRGMLTAEEVLAILGAFSYTKPVFSS